MERESPPDDAYLVSVIVEYEFVLLFFCFKKVFSVGIFVRWRKEKSMWSIFCLSFWSAFLSKSACLFFCSSCYSERFCFVFLCFDFFFQKVSCDWRQSTCCVSAAFHSSKWFSVVPSVGARHAKVTLQFGSFFFGHISCFCFANRRLKKADVIVDVLLSRGQVLAGLLFLPTFKSFVWRALLALRFLESLDKKSLPPIDAKRFLDMTIESPLVYFTVFRFFESRGFLPAPHYVQAFSKMFPIGGEVKQQQSEEVK